MGRGNIIKKQNAARLAKAEERARLKAEFDARLKQAISEIPDPPVVPDDAVYVPFDPWNYEKEFYAVKLEDGSIIKCWPNAGYMNAVDGSGRMYNESHNIQVYKLGD